MTKQLPDKLSALLRLAVEDAKKCEAMPDVYKLDMCSWHSPDVDTCAVCMAGAIVAQSLHYSPEDDVSPADIDDPLVRGALWDIDSIRDGEFSNETRRRLGWPTIDYLADIIQSRFDEKLGRADWNTYLAVADALERLGQ